MKTVLWYIAIDATGNASEKNTFLLKRQPSATLLHPNFCKTGTTRLLTHAAWRSCCTTMKRCLNSRLALSLLASPLERHQTSIKKIKMVERICLRRV